MEPRKKLRRYHEPGHLHELTFSCNKRLPLLDSDERRLKLARHIDSASGETNVRLLAFVFMPEHVHLLVQPDDSNPRLDFYLARIKQPFSAEIGEELRTSDPELYERLRVDERPGKRPFRFWLPGTGYDRNLFTPEAIAASLDYLHANPVRRGLCERASDWKWSSARFYLDPDSSPDPDLPRLTLLPMATFTTAAAAAPTLGSTTCLPVSLGQRRRQCWQERISSKSFETSNDARSTRHESASSADSRRTKLAARCRERLAI